MICQREEKLKNIDIRRYKGNYEVFVEQANGDFIVQTFAQKREAQTFVSCLIGNPAMISYRVAPPLAHSDFYGSYDRL